MKEAWESLPHDTKGVFCVYGEFHKFNEISATSNGSCKFEDATVHTLEFFYNNFNRDAKFIIINEQTPEELAAELANMSTTQRLAWELSTSKTVEHKITPQSLQAILNSNMPEIPKNGMCSFVTVAALLASHIRVRSFAAQDELLRFDELVGKVRAQLDNLNKPNPVGARLIRAINKSE